MGRSRVGGVGLFVAGLLVGCSASGTVSGKATDKPAPKASPLADVAERITSANTMRVILRITSQGETIEIAGVTDLENKKASFTTSVGDADGVESIQDGSVVYEKLPAGVVTSKSWAKFDPGPAFEGATGLDTDVRAQQSSPNPATGLGYLRGVGGDARAVGKTNLQGVPVTHCKATIDLDRASERAKGPTQRVAIRRYVQTIGAETWAQNFIKITVGSASDGLVVDRLPGIPTALAGRSTKADMDGYFEFDVIARKGDRIMIITVYNEDPAAARRLGASLAQPQYARL